MVFCFVDRKHGLAAGRRPSTKDNGDLIGVDQLLRFLSEGGPVRSTVFRGVDDLVALAVDGDAASLIDLLDGELLNLLQGCFGDGHRSTQRMEDANLDLPIKFGGCATAVAIAGGITATATTTSATGGHGYANCCRSKRCQQTL